MPRALSDIEYATFLSEVQPDSLNLPDWGGVVQWGGEYVLCYLKPMGPGQAAEWALSDITDGIPYGGQTIDVSSYVQTLPTTQLSWTDAFLYAIPQNFAQVAIQYVQTIGAVAVQAAAAVGSAAGAAASAALDTGGLALPLLILGAVLVYAWVRK